MYAFNEIVYQYNIKKQQYTNIKDFLFMGNNL